MTIELFVKLPCLPFVFEPPFTPIPLFQWYLQNKEILSDFSMNAQGSILILIVTHVPAMKTYIVTVETLRKKERQDEI